MSDKPPIKGIKLIRLNTSGIEKPDDPSMPFRMVFRARVAGMMMDFTVSSIYGPYEIAEVRGDTLEAIYELIQVNDMFRHPRFKDLEITGPDGFNLKFEPRSGVGDYMRLAEWQELAQTKLLSSDSGHGMLATNRLISNRQILPSQVKEPVPAWATHVIWYGK